MILLKIPSEDSGELSAILAREHGHPWLLEVRFVTADLPRPRIARVPDETGSGVRLSIPNDQEKRMSPRISPH
jgi:hypothetical protein